MIDTRINQILKYLSERPIAYQRIYAQMTGSVTTGLLLSQVIYWWYSSKEREFYKTDEDFRNELAMGESEFKRAKSILGRMGIISTSIRGTPRKTYYKLEVDKVIGFLTKSEETTELNRRKPPNSVGGNHRIKSEETTEPLLLHNNTENNSETIKDIMYSSPPSETNKTFSEESIEYSLSELLLVTILERWPNYYKANLEVKGAKEKRIQKWAKIIDHILRLDKRDSTEVEELIVWSQQDDFWQDNILSTAKLRKHYDKMLARKRKEESKTKIEDSNPELTKRIIDAYRKNFCSNSFKPNPYQMPKFVGAAEKLTKFSEERGIIIENTIKYLVRCLIKNFSDKERVVEPGNLCSDNVWDILLPQYVRDLGD